MKQIVSPYLFFILATGLICMACKGDASDKQASLPITDLPLSAENIYNESRVKRARKLANDAHKAVAKEKLEQSISLIDAGKKQAGRDTLIRSILHYPTAQAYFRLGNIYLESAAHEEAINTYKTAKFIEDKPNKYLLYNLACAYAMDDSDLDGKRRAINYLRMATRNGYAQKDSLLKDPRLDNIRYTYEFNRIFLEKFKQDGDETKIAFELFTQLFPKRSFPIQIEPEDLGKQFREKRQLHAPLTSIVGREEYIPDEEYYIAVAMLKRTTNFVAVMYLACSVDSPNLPYQNYEIATYTPDGKTIDKLLFADNSDPDKYLCGEIDKDLNITLSAFQNIWKNDPDQYGHRHNEIDYHEFMYEEKFKINGDGRINKK